MRRPSCHLLLRLIVASCAGALTACPPAPGGVPWDWRARPDGAAPDGGLLDGGLILPFAENSDASPYPDGWSSANQLDGPAACRYDDLDSWITVRAQFDVPYRYLFAAEVANQLRVLVEPRASGPLHVLDLRVEAGVPRIQADLTLPGTEGLEPYGFAADAQHLVAITRLIASNALDIRVYDQHGSLEDIRSFGVGSFVSASAALDTDGSVTFAVSILRNEQTGGNGAFDPAYESVVERRRSGRVELSDTSQGRDMSVVAARSTGVELVRGRKHYAVADGGLHLRRSDAFDFILAPVPYSAGWSGLSIAAGSTAFLFAPDGAQAIAYPAIGMAVGLSGNPPSESPLGIAWVFGAGDHTVLALAHRAGYTRLEVPDMTSAYGMVSFASPTDVGLFFTSDWHLPDRPLSYWGLHCPH